jgi:WD40 repeat protein
MRRDYTGQSLKRIKIARVATFLERGPLPVKDLCRIISEYSQYFEGERGLVLNGHTCKVTALAVLPAGKLASGSTDNTVCVWEDGACRHTLKGHTRSVTALAVLPDGKLASGSFDKTVRVWDAASGACLQATPNLWKLWLCCLTASWRRALMTRRCACGAKCLQRFKVVKGNFSNLCVFLQTKSGSVDNTIRAW